MIDCACGSSYDGESASVFDSKRVKSRKTHKCCECHGKINPGDIYERDKGLWDGDWLEYKTCKVCADIRKDRFHEWTYETMWDDLEMCLAENGDTDWLR